MDRQRREENQNKFASGKDRCENIKNLYINRIMIIMIMIIIIIIIIIIKYAAYYY